MFHEGRSTVTVVLLFSPGNCQHGKAYQGDCSDASSQEEGERKQNHFPQQRFCVFLLCREQQWQRGEPTQKAFTWACIIKEWALIVWAHKAEERPALTGAGHSKHEKLTGVYFWSSFRKSRVRLKSSCFTALFARLCADPEVRSVPYYLVPRSAVTIATVCNKRFLCKHEAAEIWVSLKYL